MSVSFRCGLGSFLALLHITISHDVEKLHTAVQVQIYIVSRFIFISCRPLRHAIAQFSIFLYKSALEAL